MNGRIITSLKDGDMKQDAARGRHDRSIITLTNVVILIREAAEWGMGAVKVISPVAPPPAFLP